MQLMCTSFPFMAKLNTMLEVALSLVGNHKTQSVTLCCLLGQSQLHDCMAQGYPPPLHFCFLFINLTLP